MLNNFCEASGLKVNVEKSRVMCSKNVSRRHRDNFMAISSLRFTSTLGKYLSFPLVNRRMTKAEFQVIIDKINGKLSTWKGKLLNRAGRLCLANSVMSSIPIYLMQSLWVPQSVCLKIDSLVRNFIWSGRDTTRSLSLVNWDILTTPKKFGGLNVRDSRLMNIALLGKLSWTLLTDHSKPWVSVLREKYLKGRSLFPANTPASSSLIWRNICKALHVIKPGFDFLLGNGHCSLWFTDWLGIGPLCNLLPFIHISDTDLRIIDIWQNDGWRLDRIATCLPEDIKNLIMQKNGPTFLDNADTWIWKPKVDGVFSVSSAYSWLL